MIRHVFFRPPVPVGLPFPIVPLARLVILPPFGGLLMAAIGGAALAAAAFLPAAITAVNLAAITAGADVENLAAARGAADALTEPQWPGDAFHQPPQAGLYKKRRSWHDLQRMLHFVPQSWHPVRKPRLRQITGVSFVRRRD
jgi:hypothetical protein